MTVVLHRDSIDYFCLMDLSVTAYIVLLPWDTALEPILYLLTQCLCVKFSFPTTQRNHCGMVRSGSLSSSPQGLQKPICCGARWVNNWNGDFSMVVASETNIDRTAELWKIWSETHSAPNKHRLPD